MAIWRIASGVNDGYPLYDEGASSTLATWIGTIPNLLWRFVPDMNDDYPTKPWFWEIGLLDGIIPVSFWRIVDGINDNYPYMWWQIAVQSGYIYQGDFVVGSDTDLKEHIDKEFQGADEFTEYKHNNQQSLPVIEGFRVTSGNAFSSFYKLSYVNVNQLGALLGYTTDDFWNALGTATDNKTSNILDYIVSLRWYPFTVTSFQDNTFTDELTNVLQFGYDKNAKLYYSQEVELSNPYKLGTVNRVINAGAISVPYRSETQSFLDLEPYTTVSIYLPYIGTINLQSNDVLGHTIHIYYIVDLPTGMCTGLVYNEFDTIYIGSGKIGVDIPVSGNDILSQSAQLASAYLKNVGNITGTLTGITASAVSGNEIGMISSAVNGALSIASDSIAISNAKKGIPESVGTASGFGSSYTHQTPYIKVLRPAVSIPAMYGHTTGYISNRTATLSSLNGFTVCHNPDLTGISGADSSEKTEIYQLLTTGVFL